MQRRTCALLPQAFHAGPVAPIQRPIIQPEPHALVEPADAEIAAYGRARGDQRAALLGAAEREVQAVADARKAQRAVADGVTAELHLRRTGPRAARVEAGELAAVAA